MLDLIIWLVIVAVVWGFVRTNLPMHQTLKNIIDFVIVLWAVIVVLRAFGIISGNILGPFRLR